MDDIKLDFHQTAIAVSGIGADQFGTANFDWNTCITPGLRNQIRGGDNLTRSGIFDDGEVIDWKGGVVPRQQITGPGAYLLVRFFPIAVNGDIESR